MSKKQPKKIANLHPRNKHTGRYDFEALVASSPELQSFVTPNLKGEPSINFADPKAVLTLNKALLKQQYGIGFWEIPEGNLCPPIPGRADYIHHMADWLTSNNFGRMPVGPKIKCLDIGVGASLIYPIIGATEYGWSFIGSDIDANSLESSQQIIDQNNSLQNIELRLQSNPKDILYGILNHEEKVDLTVCNPPFHSSAEEAQKGTNRKVSNLTGEKVKNADLNFSGQSNELWCEGGEKQFIRNYIKQSRKFGASVYWFSSLVSKETHLKAIYHQLENAGATQHHTIPMGQGNKTSRIVTWTFLTKAQQKEWKLSRWKV